MIKKSISGELFLLPNDSNRYLGFWFDMFCFFLKCWKGQFVYKIICGTFALWGVIGKEMT